MPAINVLPGVWTLLDTADVSQGRWENDAGSAAVIELQGVAGAVGVSEPAPSPISLRPGEGIAGTLAEFWSGLGATRVYARSRHIGARLSYSAV